MKMTDNIGTWYIFNEDVQSEEQLKNVRVPENHVVYEVIRIIEGVPLFLEDHYRRLKESFHLLGRKLTISEEALKTKIHQLTKVCGQKNCNVKVMVYPEQEQQNLLIYLSKYYYPTKEEVEKGVPVGLLLWERQEPNAKIMNHIYKEVVSKKIREQKVFEVLLVNRQNNITEGSRSNVFFVKGNKVITASGEHILKGITRQYVLEACKKAGVEVIEKLVHVNELNSMEGVFLSGTSIKVLPVSGIDEMVYQSGIHSTVIAIRNQFDLLVDEYVKNYKLNNNLN